MSDALRCWFARMFSNVLAVVAGAAVLAGSPLFAQPAGDPLPEPNQITAPSTPAPEYRIGPHDLLSIAVLQAPELNTTARVNETGEISLPLLGAVRAGGLTVQELELLLEERLQQKYVRQPDVTVDAKETQIQTVSVLGAVRRPGVLQIRGASTLLEVLSLAGGLTEQAGESVIILRRSDAVDVRLKQLAEGREPGANPPIFPGDIVNVQMASTVYVVGEVNKPGAFMMRSTEPLTVLRAIALSGGLTPDSMKGSAVVLRTNPDGARVEVPVDLGDILKGIQADVVLLAEDVLFVPTNGAKAAARATIYALLRLVTLRPF